MRGWLLLLLAVLSGCDGFSDSATRLAFELEAAQHRLGTGAGARYTLEHRFPSRAGECEGPYTVQIDDVGALIVWCRDAAGRTVSSHSTSYHARFVEVPRTYRLEKPAGSPLVIDLERRHGRAVIVAAR